MNDIDPTLKREIYQVQQDLIELGWDDVELVFDEHKFNQDDVLHVIAKYNGKSAPFTVMKNGLNYRWKSKERQEYPWKRWYKNDKLTQHDVILSARGSLGWIKAHELVQFAERPGSFHDVMKTKRTVVSWSKIKQLVDEGVLSIYESRKVFSPPLVTPGAGFRTPRPFNEHEKMIVVSFDFETTGFRYMLADLTEANTYVRNWAYATTVEDYEDL